MPPCWCPVFRILYRFLAALARLTVRSGRSKDLEIIVLRHQLMVLRRQIDRPELNDDDRCLLGAIAAALPRRLRDGWIVTPETLLPGVTEFVGTFGYLAGHFAWSERCGLVVGRESVGTRLVD